MAQGVRGVQGAGGGVDDEEPPLNTRPENLDDRDLLTALREQWGIAADTVTYIPKGFGSYHWSATIGGAPVYFLTVDDLDNRPWLGHDRESAFAGMSRACDTALALRHDAGLDFVVAPVPTRDGHSIARLSPRYSLAVFEHINGDGGTWGDGMTAADRRERLQLLARLHGATDAVRAIAPHRPFELAGRRQLSEALRDLEAPWSGGPFSEPARQAMRANIETLKRRIASFENLAEHMRSRPDSALVITHGEPHPGNLIRVDGQLRLIDWDTVALAAPERDLWPFDESTPQSPQPYIEAAECDVDARAIDFYRIAWDLEDIAVYAALFRGPHTRNADTEKAWSGFPGLLGS